MKASEWLQDLDSHAIYHAERTMQDYRKNVERPAPDSISWPVRTAEQMRKDIVRRGLGGSLEGDGDAMTGWEIAEAIALAARPNYQSIYMGRGRRFFQALEQLQKDGF